MKRLYKILFTLSIVFSLSGCLYKDSVTDLFKNKKVDVTTPDVIPVDDLTKELVLSLSNASYQDCVDLYKFCISGADYCKYVKTLNNNGEFYLLLSKVEEVYGWDREKYKRWNDLTEADLNSKGLDENQEISKVRAVLVETFSKYANAAKLAAEQKNAKP